MLTDTRSRRSRPSLSEQNWNRTINSTTYGFAWALMAGFSYQITPSIAIDIGYRYLNGGSTRTLVNAQTGTTLKQSQRLPAGPRRRPLPDPVGLRTRSLTRRGVLASKGPRTSAGDARSCSAP